MTNNISSYSRNLYWGFLLVLAVLMTLKYFPGLENEDAYAGLSYQAIYPDAMAGDEFYGPQLTASEAQYRLSAFYLLPKLFGDIWLDDRFIVFLYLLSVIAAMYLVDKISIVLGANKLIDRALVMILVLKDNEMLGNKVLLSHHPDFNHSALAIPIALWLYYLVLSKKNFYYIISIAALLAAVSIKNAVIPVASTLIIMSITRTEIKDKWLSCILLFICSIVTIYGIFFLFAPPESERLTLWNYLVVEFRRPGNPFYAFENAEWYSIGQFTLFLIFSISTLKWKTDNKALFQPIRIVIFMALFIWLTASAYISFAPDPIKIPTILSFSWNSRALQFPQILMYIALPILIMRWVEKKPSQFRILTKFFFIAALFLVAPKNVPLWFGVLVFSTILTICGYLIFWNHTSKTLSFSPWLKTKRASFAAISLSITLVISLLGTTIKTKIPAWTSLIEFGVFGDAASAPWINISSWVKSNTKPSDPILTFVLSENGQLQAVRSLATRTGRPQTQIHRGSRQFDAGTWQIRTRQDRLIEQIASAWKNGAAKPFNTALSQLVMKPVFLIFPDNYKRLSGDIETTLDFRTKIDGYVIYQRKF